ncbi:peptidylprolyl isomerase [Oceanicoccus sp. KOV_DT_Chl]|uniref:peptidylprolyl isomerase n=1 Tax=Oceanicoccus sp. KOV_DT_Chl TaxID=1904639 RepID=UPI000C79E8A6|nr:peptidylprolyl isomerase [Oceanicoccus sp. KOV_DT_Chl]
MIRTFSSFLLLSIFLFSSSVFAESSSNNPIVIMKTSKGDITLELYPQQAPITVANFLDYAQSGFYNDTIFHRVIKRFMIQGGGFTRDLNRKETKAEIINESGNGLHNDRWTIAMARTNDPDSASSQFFINTKMNSSLDARGQNAGYAVFGMVIDGQHVVKAIEKTPTAKIGMYSDVPVEPVIIQSVTVKK